MKKSVYLLIVVALLGAACKKAGPQPGKTIEGTVVNSKMSVEEQIEKIKNDKNIPEMYKQSYINSVQQKAAQGGGK